MIVRIFFMNIEHWSNFISVRLFIHGVKNYNFYYNLAM